MYNDDLTRFTEISLHMGAYHTINCPKWSEEWTLCYTT